jgi:hypothetical protein
MSSKGSILLGQRLGIIYWFHRVRTLFCIFIYSLDEPPLLHLYITSCCTADFFGAWIHRVILVVYLYNVGLMPAYSPINTG